jgi:type 1 glutamine amidotransferase
VVLNGDDVYEDLFSAGLKLQELLAGLGFATRTVMGTARLAAPAEQGAPAEQAALAEEGADLIVLYTAMGYFPPARQAALAEAVRAGAGLLALHASNVFPSAGGRLDEDYRPAFELIGSRYVSHGPRPHESRFRVEFRPDHMLSPGRGPFEITHEHYQLELASGAEVVAWRQSDAGPEPIAHVREHGRGRVCYLQLGHDMRAWDDPLVRTLVTRAALWAVGEKEAVAV